VPPVPQEGAVNVIAPVAVPPVRVAKKVKVSTTVPDVGWAVREAVRVAAVTLTDAVGVVEAPPCETVIEAVRVPVVA